jgi:hypothetical protein
MEAAERADARGAAQGTARGVASLGGGVGRLGVGILAGMKPAPPLMNFVRGGAGFTPANFLPRAYPPICRCARPGRGDAST